jgi:hypothetical protein
MKSNWNMIMMGAIEKFVFVSSNDQGSLANSYSTFSALFTSILSVNYVQPWFGGNYIEIAFKPMPDGGLPVGAIAMAQLRTDGRGLYEFSATMQHWMEVARRKQQEASTLRELISHYAKRLPTEHHSTAVYTPPRSDTGVTTQSLQPSSASPHLLDTPNELPPAYTI